MFIILNMYKYMQTSRTQRALYNLVSGEFILLLSFIFRAYPRLPATTSINVAQKLLIALSDKIQYVWSCQHDMVSDLLRFAELWEGVFSTRIFIQNSKPKYVEQLVGQFVLLILRLLRDSASQLTIFTKLIISLSLFLFFTSIRFFLLRSFLRFFLIKKLSKSFW